MILGAGDLGSHYARLAKLLGAHTVALRRQPRANVQPKLDGIGEEYAMAKLLEELLKADIVASFLPANSATRGIANADFFAAMKDSAYFINCGRGVLVEENVMLEALASGKFAGAALDVVAEEPLSQTSKLWDQDCLIILNK